MQDVMIDADRLVKEIRAAAWDQRFDTSDGGERRGNGISTGRLLSCVRASLAPPSETYTELPGSALLARFLMLGGKPTYSDERALEKALGNTYEASTRRFCHGERAMFNAVQGLQGEPQFLLFYLVFHEEIDRLISLASREPGVTA